VIGRFLFLVDANNWKENSKLLKKKEIIKVKKLYSMLKKDLSKYLDLIYQIELITSKIDKLEGEKNGISVKYNGLNERLEKTIEESQELDKTYFLNSYLSTKNLSLENFVTSPIVEKQITNIVEANKK
jgi:predicted transcriptional regulator